MDGARAELHAHSPLDSITRTLGRAHLASGLDVLAANGIVWHSRHSFGATAVRARYVKLFLQVRLWRGETPKGNVNHDDGTHPSPHRRWPSANEETRRCRNCQWMSNLPDTRPAVSIDFALLLDLTMPVVLAARGDLRAPSALSVSCQSLLLLLLFATPHFIPAWPRASALFAGLATTTHHHRPRPT